MSPAPTPTKKTVYVDVDEEITGIIDKVRSTKESIVALVLPKRATVLQSIVNMKLLKRAADQGKKKVVLITSESTLLPLAGAAGIHVAANLQSRPYLPARPDAEKLRAAAAAADQPNSTVPPIDPETPIGDRAKVKDTDPIKPIEIDNRSKASIDPKVAAAADKPKKEKTPNDKAKKVPNFQKFRVLLFAGAGALIALIIFGYWALAIAPKATITLRTESSETDTEADFIASTTADQLDLETDTLPATSKELKKSETEKVTATGEKDNGTKAGGTVALRNCTDNKITIPAGTGISNGSLTFITQAPIQLDDGDFTGSGQCKTSGGHVGNVNVVAQKNGDAYNLSSRSYTVSGFSGVVAQGDQMSGGTSKTVKVVSAADVDAAKKKITDKQNAVVDEIKGTLKSEGYIGLVDTFNAGTPNFKSTPAVDAEAAEVTVTADITYTMLGIKEDDLKKIIEDQAKEKVDTSKQSILDYGLDDATFEVGTKRASTTNISIKTKLVAGPEINQDSLKEELAGTKKGEAESQLKTRPGITEARVETSPFWVTKVPGKAAKVNLIIEQANGTPITP